MRELYRKLFILCYQHKSASDATLVSFMQMSVDILRVGMRSELQVLFECCDVLNWIQSFLVSFPYFQSADETCLSDFTDLPQRVNVIVSAFRTRKTLTEMVLEVLMDSFDTLQNDMVGLFSEISIGISPNILLHFHRFCKNSLDFWDYSCFSVTKGWYCVQS